MKVVGTANIVSRDQGGERSSSVLGSGLDTSQSVGENGRVGSITVAPCLYTSVYTLL